MTNQSSMHRIHIHHLHAIIIITPFLYSYIIRPKYLI